MRASNAVVVAVTCSLGGASCLDLQRADTLGPGDIRLSVERDGEDVEGAVVRALSARVTVSRSDGGAQLRALPVGQWPLVITVDDDGDGIADGAAVDARAEVRDVGSTVTPEFTGVDLGAVALSDTGVLGGTASCAAEELCRVVVVRTVTAADGVAYTLPAEASTGVAADGTWRIEGLAPGTVSVVTFVWDRSPLPALVAATRPTRIGVVEATVGEEQVIAAAETPATATSSTLTLRAAQGVLDRAAGQVNSFVPTATTAATADGASSTIGPLSEEAPEAEVVLPPGLIDLRVQLEEGSGALFNVVVVPGGAPLVPIAIGTTSCLAFDGGVDCNGDGKNDAAELADPAGIDAGDVDLDNNGVADGSDTDLDHDGVADTTEPTACRQPGLGADRDADCLCDLVDPFPDCAGNDPLACDVAVPAVCE